MHNRNQEDPRITQAKQLLQEVILDRKKQITQISLPNKSLEGIYQHKLEEFAKHRGVPLGFPYLGSGIGNGPFVELLDGSIKYDFICGIGVHFLGHSHPALIEASTEAILSDLIMQGNLQQNEDSYELSKLLTDVSHLPHCFLTSSGAMALENGLKLAFQKNFPAQRIFAFERSFCGRTLALSQITDKPSFREGLPPTIQVDYVPFFDPLEPEKSLERALYTIKTQIKRYPKGHAAMILELVQGEAGSYPGSTPFFSAIMQLLKENGIAVIVDEIQTFGRTPELFAYQYFNVEKYVDICTIGKLSYVCATLFTEEYRPRTGLLSQTFTANTVSIRCSSAMIKTLLNLNLYGKEGKIQRFHHLFSSELAKLAERHPSKIIGPFGLGGMIAFTPFEGEAKLTMALVRELFDAGLMTFYAGQHPMRIRMLPPIPVLNETDVHAAIKIIESVLANHTIER
jgi:acetylornithine/N-succinyldiaminopimelate aminotransferase